MISFESFTKNDNSPVYLQIVKFIKQGIVSGVIKNGDKLPSRRELSAQIKVNPSTVQKAYTVLEEDYLIESPTCAKSTMVLDEDTIVRVEEELKGDDIREIISSLKRMGVTKDEAKELLERNWE